MAQLKVNSNSGLDMRTLSLANIIKYATSYTEKSTIFIAHRNGGYEDKFSGSSFTYADNGAISGGTVTDYAFLRWNTALFQFNNINVAATKLAAAANTISTYDDFKIFANVLSGADNLLGGNRSDYIQAYGGNDLINGRDGQDTLFGGAGNDRLIGGRGRDTLDGNEGSDRFIFAGGDSTSSNPDRINDFSEAEKDSIDISIIDSDSAIVGNQAFKFIGSASFSGASGEVRFENSGTNTSIFADTNGDSIADFTIILKGLILLQASDFIL